MSWGVVGAAAVTVVGGAYQKNKANKAAKKAAGAQGAAEAAAIEEERRQFDAVTQMLRPYVSGGENAFREMQFMLGIGYGGEAERQEIIQNLQQGPEFQAMVQQGENAILQNASATGGLRGGNTQAALAQFRPMVLNDLINQRFQRLSGMAGLGQAAAARQAAAGQSFGASAGNRMSNIGAAQAGLALAQGQNQADMWGNIGDAFGTGLGAWLNRPQTE